MISRWSRTVGAHFSQASGAMKNYLQKYIFVLCVCGVRRRTSPAQKKSWRENSSFRKSDLKIPKKPKNRCFRAKKWWWFGGNAKFGAKYDFRNPENQTRTAKNLDEHNPLGFEAERALPWPAKLPNLCTYRPAPTTMKADTLKFLVSYF